MSIHTIQDLLPLVEMPSRYLGTETNRVEKREAGIRLSVALAFPDLYEIGTSHFGLQILYHILNRHPEIAAERVFAPGVDMAAHLHKNGLALASLESRKPLKRFDIIGFSLLYEMNYTNVLLMLALSGLPFYARDRDESFPLIIAGGPCTVNPEPVAEFFDAMVIGDGESTIMAIAEVWLQWKAEGSGDKDRLLNGWSAIQGVYIPAFFEPVYDKDGFQRIRNGNTGSERIKRAVLADLDRAPFPDAPVVPYGRPVHDRLRLEISRGCTRGCRFCQAGMIYRPVRERAPETLLRIYERSAAATGYEDLSLLSLSTGDYSCILPLMQRLMQRCEGERVAVSLPSLRAGTLSPEMMQLIQKVRKTGFTIAPEAGSQRLRDVINKNISEADIFETVRSAFMQGWKVAKLYFMVGLPTERDADLRAIADMVFSLKKALKKDGCAGKLNVSVATFIPKAHTPFQWAAQDPLKEATEKIMGLRSRLKKPGIHFKWQNPQISLLEGLWARGDRRLGQLLVKAFKAGCMFDGWSDRFDYDLWMSAVTEAGTNVDFYTTRQRSLAEPLPWDHIETGVTGDFLKQEWQKAVREELTPDCRWGDCNDCGVCDFETIAPVTFEGATVAGLKQGPSSADCDAVYKTLTLTYAKKGPAKFFGHLEMASVFIRAIRRAGISVAFSRGFHPKPKISFDDPLPVGMESEQETLRISVPVAVRSDRVRKELNRQLPPGLSVIDCRVSAEAAMRRTPEKISYFIRVNDSVFEEKKVKCFTEKSSWVITRKRRKGPDRRIDLKMAVLKMECIDTDTLRLTVAANTGITVRPAEVLEHVFGLSGARYKMASIVKEKAAAPDVP